MRRFFLAILSLGLIVQLHANQLSEPLSVFEGDPAGIILDSIDVISGSYREVEEDCVIPAPEPLRVRRHYSSAQEKFFFFPQCLLVVSEEKSACCAFSRDTNGTLLQWEKKNKEWMLSDDIFLKGTANTARGTISAQTNLKNFLLVQDNGKYTITTSDGHIRQYEKSSSSSLGKLIGKAPIKGTTYRLAAEVLPSGNQFLYLYSKEGALSSIEATNSKKSKTFASIRVEYSDNKIVLRGSGGEKVSYRFNKEGLIDSVDRSNKQSLSYRYKDRKIVRKKQEEDCGISIVYNEKGRVTAFNMSGEATPIYTISYTKGGRRVVTDALGNRRIFYKKDDRLVAIEYFEGEKFIKKEAWIWAAQRVSELVAQVTYNESREPIAAIRYQYDDGNKGELHFEQLYGNVTGQEEKIVKLDASGIPIFIPDLWTSSHKYSQDRFHQLIQKIDCKDSAVSYTYLPNSNLLHRKEVKGRCVEEYSYNEDGQCIKQVIGDRYVDPSLITLIIIPRAYSKGKATEESIEERYFDKEKKCEQLKKRTVSRFDSQGNLTAKIEYGSSGERLSKVTFEYDVRGNVTKEASADGSVITYSYDKCGNQISRCERSKNITYAYDRLNRLIAKKVQYTNGPIETTSYRYDAMGNKIEERDQLGRSIEYSYNACGKIVSLKLPQVPSEAHGFARPVYHFTYDIFGNTTSRRDPEGNTEETTYTVNNKPLQISYPDGTEERFKWDREGTLHRKLNRDRTVNVFEYDARGQCVLSERSEVKDNGNMGNFLECWGFTHSSNGLTRVGHREKYISNNLMYNNFGQVSTQNLRVAASPDFVMYTDPVKIKSTEYEYDSSGRVVRKKSYINGTDVKRWLHYLEPDDFVTECTAYNPEGQIVETWNEQSDGKRLSFRHLSYDQDGNIASIRQPHGTEQFFYTAGSRLSRYIDASNQVTSLFYTEKHDAFGNTLLETKMVDPSGNISLVTKDALDREVAIIMKDCFGQILTQKEQFFDGCNHLIAVVETDPRTGKKERTEWHRGPTGRVERLIQAAGTQDSKETLYVYNNYGKVASISYPGGITHNYAYDSRRHLQKVVATNNKGISTIELRYDSFQRLVYARKDSVVLNRKYTPMNCVGEEEWRVEGDIIKIGYEYDSHNRVTKIVLPNGSSIQYTYRGAIPEAVIRYNSSQKELYRHEFTEYNEEGFPTLEKLIGVVGQRKNTFTATGDLYSIETDRYYEAIQSRDASGRVQSRYRNSEVQNFAYDARDRLIKEPDIAYEYDAFNNILSRNEETFEYNALNQPLSNCTYNASGQLVKKGEQQFAYDPFFQLSTFQNEEGKKVEYLTDFAGRRVFREENGKKEFYLHIGLTEVGNVDRGWNVTSLKVPKSFRDGNAVGAVAIELQGKVYAPTYDLEGNIAQLLDLATGDLVESYDYTAFGNERIFDDTDYETGYSLVGNPWRYQGLRKDSLTALVRCGLRDYDPSIMRFLTEDPAEYADGMNLYAYANNSPLQYNDPSGLAAEPLDTKYFYGMYETHCYCQVHRACKRGGDIVNEVLNVSEKNYGRHAISTSRLMQGLWAGSKESATSLPSMIWSVTKFVGSSLNNPRQAYQEMRGMMDDLLKFIEQEGAHAALWVLFPEATDLIKSWDKLDPVGRGEKLGYVIARYGVDAVTGRMQTRLLGAVSLRRRKISQPSPSQNPHMHDLLTAHVAKTEQEIAAASCHIRSTPCSFENQTTRKVAAISDELKREQIAASRLNCELQGRHVVGHPEYMYDARSVLKIKGAENAKNSKELNQLIKEQIEPITKLPPEKRFTVEERGLKRDIIVCDRHIGTYKHAEGELPTIILPTDLVKTHDRANGITHVVPEDPLKIHRAKARAIKNGDTEKLVELERKFGERLKMTEEELLAKLQSEAGG